MGPPLGEVKVEVDSSTLQNLMEQENADAGAATTVLTVNADEEGESGVTYFVDEEGRYYYQSADNPQNIMTLPTVENGEIEEESNQMLVEGTDGFQTVTLLPSDHVNGDVSYVLVVQEDSKPILGFEQPAEPTVKGETEDVYNFEEEEAEGPEVAEEEEGDEAEEGKKKSKKGKSGWPKFTCTFCNYTSPRRYLLLRHMKSHSQERPHKCSVCERGFKTLASLQNHVNMHNGVKPHICKYCDSPFTTSGELVRHVRYKHTLERPHKCTECDYASVELSKLRRHIRCHTGERPYQCPHCTYASPDTFKLKRHLRTHTGEKPYKCDSCDMCFTQSNSLKAHKLIHNITDKPVYSCKLCPRTCGRKTDLRIHLQKLHSSDKPHKCKRCGKTFPDRYSCKIHNKTHEGEKCFKCGYCPYASTAMRHLKSHMLKHTDEKPFVCEQCDQPFRQKQLLKRHQNLYHNPDYVPKPPKEKTHSCHECKRQFAHKGNLIRHLAIHDPESDVQERALALKLGRQRKVKFINGAVKTNKANEQASEDEEQTTLLKFNIGENDLKRGEVVTIDDGDSQQYVVLEVIQLDDGTEQHVAVVAPHTGNALPETDNEDEPAEEIEDPIDIQPPKLAPRGGKKKQKEKPTKDVDSCFGFDEEEEDEQQQQEDDFENKVIYVY